MAAAAYRPPEPRRPADHLDRARLRRARRGRGARPRRRSTGPTCAAAGGRRAGRCAAGRWPIHTSTRWSTARRYPATRPRRAPSRRPAGSASCSAGSSLTGSRPARSIRRPIPATPTGAGSGAGRPRRAARVGAEPARCRPGAACSAWSTSELFGHTHNVAADHARFFDDAVDRLGTQLGSPADPSARSGRVQVATHDAGQLGGRDAPARSTRGTSPVRSTTWRPPDRRTGRRPGRPRRRRRAGPAASAAVVARRLAGAVGAGHGHRADVAQQVQRHRVQRHPHHHGAAGSSPRSQPSDGRVLDHQGQPARPEGLDQRRGRPAAPRSPGRRWSTRSRPAPAPACPARGPWRPAARAPRRR